LRSIYDEITVHFRDDYLGMTFIYCLELKTIILMMKNYIKGVLEQFTQDNSSK
jgi:hypothetical protein